MWMMHLFCVTSFIMSLSYPQRAHWSMFTATCRWQRRLAIRYIAGFLEQNGSTHDKLMEMVCLLTLILNRKSYHIAHGVKKSFCFKTGVHLVISFCISRSSLTDYDVSYLGQDYIPCPQNIKQCKWFMS